jgi:ribulose-phosphate 3-epimerase
MFISPSIASADVCNIENEVKFTEKHFSHIHLDIEDGVYLNNLSFGMKTVKRICQLTNASISVHLEVYNPMVYLNELASLPIDDLFIHTDHLENPLGVIKTFQSKGIHTGLGLSNRDLNNNILPLLEIVDSILVLSAEIEDPKQEYSEKMDDFIRKLSIKKTWKIWVDGGIKKKHIHRLQSYGVYAAVMGRAVFKDKLKAKEFFEK